MNDNDERTIWCGNLSEKVTEEILYELFYQVGPLERVYIPKDSDGRSRQYGFVTFCHACSIEYALKVFRGTRLFDREVSMKSRVVRNNPGPQYPYPFLPKTFNSPELSDSDFIRGLSITPMNAFELNNSALRNPSYSDRMDRSMLPNRKAEESNGYKRNYEDSQHCIPGHTTNESLKSSYINTQSRLNDVSYRHYLELGKQMLFGATILPPLLVNSVCESYYRGADISPPIRDQSSRHSSYHSKSDRPSYTSHRKSTSHKSHHHRSYDRRDRRSN